MFGKEFRLYIGMFLKFLIIMLVPLTFNLYGSTGLLQSLASSFLLTSLFYSGGVFAGQITMNSVSALLSRNLLLGLIVTFPGIVYNYKLHNIPLNKSYWKMGFAVCFAIVLDTVAVAGFLVPLLTGGYNYWNTDYYLLSNALSIYPVLVMGAFIILPLIERLGVAIASPLDIHDQSMQELMQEPELKIKRERRLARFLWVALCFSPIVFQFSVMYGNSFNLSGLLFGFSFSFYSGYLEQYFFFYGGITSLATIETMALYSAGNFYFVREIYRYLRKQVTKHRLWLVGVLATLLPILIPRFTYYYIYEIYYSIAIIPIPLVFLLGLMIAKLHRPNMERVDRVWTDEQHEYWWDKKSGFSGKDEEVFSTPETPYRNSEDLVKVPIHYRIISKLKKLTNRNDS